MEQAQEHDEAVVRLLSNLADGVHSGYIGDVVRLPAELAAQLVEAGFAEAFVEPQAEPVKTPKKRGKGK